jgi:hypothetical protein
MNVHSSQVKRATIGALIALGCLPVHIEAQRALGVGADSADARLVCASSGFAARAWSGDSIAPVPAPQVPTMAHARREVVDTTIVLAITDRRWQRNDVDAGVALGGAGTVRSLGEWTTCAGASVHLGGVAVQLHNVSGNIHFRADPSALDSIGRTRSTPPPAGPPRR